ncbi:hypothetical protein BH24ACT19_BH24ACT19_11320 [soil metagenome]
MASDERLRELEEKYEGYTVYDNAGEKIGKVDELFVDETDREEYIGVEMGLFGLSGTTLVPMEISRVDEQGRRIEVAETKEHVKDAPTYSDDDQVDAGFEDRIRRHFGLGGGAGQGSYGRASGTSAGGAAAGATMGEDDTMAGDRDIPDRRSGASMGGVEDRERVGQETYQNREDIGSGPAMGGARAGSATPSGSIPDIETSERGRAEEDVGSMTRGHREGGDREDPGTSGVVTGSGAAEEGRSRRDAGERGDQGYGDRSGTSTEGRDDEARSGGTGETQTGDPGRTEDERVREAVREGVREGIREGLREGGERSESGGRGGSGTSGSMRGSGSTGEGMIQHGGEPGGEGDLEDRGTTGPRDETRDMQQRSGEGEQEEGGVSKVWRRVQR